MAAASLLAAWNLAVFTVPQWMQAIVVQLGEPVRTVQEPGLYWKIPFIQNVLYFDQRLLDYDASPREILTSDKQQLVVDNYSRWRIVDPLQFYRTVRNEDGAQSRLDDIIYSNLRETLGRHTLREIVSEKRAALMEQVTKRSDEKAREYGIEVVDVRIKRADLPEKNELNVFNRMRTERERLAKKFRAEGDEEARKIRSESDKEVQILTGRRAPEGRDHPRRRRRAGGEDLRRRLRPRPGVLRSSCARSRPTARRSARARRVILSPNSDFFRYLKQLDPSRAP